MLIKKSRLESYGLAIEGGNDNRGKDGLKRGKQGDQGNNKKWLIIVFKSIYYFILFYSHL